MEEEEEGGPVDSGSWVMPIWNVIIVLVSISGKLVFKKKCA